LISFSFSRLRRQLAGTNVRSGPERQAPLAFPLNFSGKVALYEGPGTALDELCALAPEAIAAPLQRALDLADARMKGLMDLPSLSFAVVVLTDLSGAPLDRRQRDLLWRAFQVPVFEQLRDWDGEVIARECEAHSGLHLIEGTDARIEHGELWIDNRRTGRAGSITHEHCECGVEAAVLRELAVFSAAWSQGFGLAAVPCSELSGVL
jgi:hypothetical protein